MLSPPLVLVPLALPPDTKALAPTHAHKIDRQHVVSKTLQYGYIPSPIYEEAFSRSYTGPQHPDLRAYNGVSPPRPPPSTSITAQGCTTLLVDEDTCATNFMIRDIRMQM